MGGPLDQRGHVTFLWKERQRASWVLPRGRVRVLGARGGEGKAGGVRARCPPQQHRMPQDPALLYLWRRALAEDSQGLWGGHPSRSRKRRCPSLHLPPSAEWLVLWLAVLPTGQPLG